MQSISHFKDHYIDPVIQSPAFHLVCLAVAEVIKIIAVKIFLEYLGQRFLSHPSIRANEVYDATVLAPIGEEIIFRFVVLQSIHLVQLILEDFSKKPKDENWEPCFRFQLYSNIFAPEEGDDKLFTIPLHLPLAEELIYRGLRWGINSWQECRPFIRIQVISHVFRHTIPKEEGTFVIPVSPPIVEEVVFRVCKNILNELGDVKKAIFNSTHFNSMFKEDLAASDSFRTNTYFPVELDILFLTCTNIINEIHSIGKSIFNRIHFNSMFKKDLAVADSFRINTYFPVELDILYQAIVKDWAPHSFGVFTDEERRQQVLRIHFAALIFAAAHLSNNHFSKAGAITQFVWTYIGGVAYGYLSEKYHSLAPGMLFHGLNNSISSAAPIYPEGYIPLILLALIANKVSAYILGITLTQAQQEEKGILDPMEDDLEVEIA